MYWGENTTVERHIHYITATHLYPQNKHQIGFKTHSPRALWRLHLPPRPMPLLLNTLASRIMRFCTHIIYNIDTPPNSHSQAWHIEMCTEHIWLHAMKYARMKAANNNRRAHGEDEAAISSNRHTDENRRFPNMQTDTQFYSHPNALFMIFATKIRCVPSQTSPNPFMSSAMQTYMVYVMYLFI